MVSATSKTVLLLVWPIAVVIVAIAIGIRSLPNWLIVTAVAIVPPLVVRRFWHAPEQTISESIDEARR